MMLASIFGMLFVSSFIHVFALDGARAQASASPSSGATARVRSFGAIYRAAARTMTSPPV